MLIDTDVLIWYLRGNEQVRKIVEFSAPFRLSVISYMELVQGMADKRELNVLRRTMKEWRAEVVYINEAISSRAMLYVEEHFLSHSIQLADALIAATAVEYAQELLSGNAKHYRMIRDVKLKTFKVKS